MISSHSGLRRDGVLCVIDVTEFESFNDVSYSAREQSKFTDLLVFNKVELVDFARKKQVVEYVREVNEYAPIIEALNGIVPIELVTGMNTKHISLRSAQTNHVHTDQLDSLTIQLSQPVDIDRISQQTRNFPSNVIRIKGCLKDGNGDWYIYNKVGQRITLEKIEENSALSSSFLMCIGFDIDPEAIRSQCT
jgi:G3E family GTPase